MTTDKRDGAADVTEPTATRTDNTGSAATETAPAGAAAEQRPFWRRLVSEAWTANTVTVTILAVVLALLVGAVLIIITNDDARAAWGYVFAAPGDALQLSWYAVRDAYVALFEGAIFDPSAVSAAVNGTGSWTLVFYPISETLTYAAPLIFTGLAVALAFRAGLFNIGAEGQVIWGAIGAGAAGFLFHLPPGLHLIVALLGGVIGGGIWGFIPGWLKARTGAHEVITTIMLNYIASIFLLWLITQKGIQDPHRSDAISKKVDGSAQEPHLFGSDLRVNLGIVLAVLAAAGVAWLLNRSTIGFEFRAVGANPDAARTAGMSPAATYAAVMSIAGVLAGLGGATLVLGTAHALTPAVSANTGFNGITVALLGRARPWGVVGAGLLVGALSAGAAKMQAVTGIPIDMVNVLQALIVVFIVAPALVIAVFRLRAQRVAGLTTTLAKGW